VSIQRERDVVGVDRVPTDAVQVLAAPAPGQRARWWAEAERWSRRLDSAVRIPGTQRRVGLDGVVGFIPVVGDAAGLALAAIVITRGVLLGARGWTVARMVLVAGVDALIGLIPVAGGVFDFVFKANERNVRTIERHELDRSRTERESRRVVLVTLAAMAVAGIVVVALTVTAIAWLVQRYA
jgi:hypothetical protein